MNGSTHIKQTIYNAVLTKFVFRDSRVVPWQRHAVTDMQAK